MNKGDMEPHFVALPPHTARPAENLRHIYDFLNLLEKAESYVFILNYMHVKECVQRYFAN